MYQFGPFNLDPVSVRLTKNDEEIEVEPRVFNTLELLLKHNARVVTKDELLETIWQSREVTESVITRIIYELRKLLDEGLEQGSYIRTVRGKGYQFDVPVSEQNNSYDSATNPKPVLKIHKRPNHHKLVVLGVTSLVLFLSYHFISQNNKKEVLTGFESQQANDTYSVVTVLPIEVEAGNDKLSMLVQSLVDYLSHQLTLNLKMKVIHPDSLIGMGSQLDDVWAIQKATHSDFIIKGFMEPVAQQRVKLHLSLYKNNVDGVLTPFSLGTFEFPYPESSKDLNDLYKKRKVTVRSIVEIIKPGMVVKDNGDFETNDPEAYRLVIAAHHIARTDDCKDMQRAEQLLLKAVARDDEFVYAYLQLFSNYYKRVWICGESTDYHKKGLAMAAIVDRLAPHSYQAVDMRRSTILVESNQVEEAYELTHDIDWGDPEIIYHQSYILRYAGFLNITSQYVDRIVQLDPFFYSDKPIRQAPNTLLYQNQFDDHLALLAEPGNSYHDYFRGLNLYLTGQKERALMILRGVVNRTPEDLFGKFSQALLHVIKGEDSKATAAIDEIVLLRKNKKHTDGEMTYKLAQLYAMSGANDLALVHFQTAVDQGFFPVNYFLIDPAMQSIQHEPKFAVIVDQATQRHEAFAKQFNLVPETVAVSGVK